MRIALTGGPGGGKSSLVRELRAEDPAARKWVAVPEAATVLIQAGLSPRTRPFQEAVIRLQLVLEAEIERSAREEGRRDDFVLLCDRGTLDSLAYWRLGGWPEEEFHALSGMDLDEHISRYVGIIHLQTTAIGAGMHYRRGRTEGRHEAREQAAEIDRLCGEAWGTHPRYILIENTAQGWPAKLATARQALKEWTA